MFRLLLWEMLRMGELRWEMLRMGEPARRINITPLEFQAAE
jgi:hypothetical protein